MKSPAICYSDHWPFKSASFRNNEQFRRTWAELIDRRSSWRKCITDPQLSSKLASWFASMFSKLSELDRWFLQAEKIPMLRGYIAEVIEVQIRQELSSGLRVVDNFIDEEVSYKSSPSQWNCFFLSGFHMLLFPKVDDLCSFQSRWMIQLFLDNVLAPDQADLELVSAVVLSIVYQYLLGYVDRGGTKTYNPGSLEFRATYISLLLFRGAYVWIKFRDVARNVYRRFRKDEFGQVQYFGKHEPRFKPPREKGFPKHDYLPLGGYDTHRDAKVVCQIAGFYYGKDEEVVVMDDDYRFSIPEMSEQERSFRGEEKRKWVSAKAKAVFSEFKERAALSANPGEQVDARGFSLPADQAVVAFSTASGYEFAASNLPSRLAHAHHDPLMPFDPKDLLNSDADFAAFQEAFEPTMQERSDGQLNLETEQVLADFNGWFAGGQQNADLAIFQEAFEPSMQERSDGQLNLDMEQVLADVNGWFAEEQQNAYLAVFQEALEPTMQESLDEQLHLQEELLADFNRQLAEERQKRRLVEEENMKLRQENKHLKTMLQQAATPLRAFFVTSTVELESPIENC